MITPFINNVAKDGMNEWSVHTLRGQQLKIVPIKRYIGSTIHKTVKNWSRFGLEMSGNNFANTR